jgi:hypothetical protein
MTNESKNASLVSLSMLRRLHHSQPRRMHTGIVWLRFLFFLSLAALLQLGFLLLLALALLHLEFGALFAVAGALVVQFVVLGYDAGFTIFAVTAAASAVCALVPLVWRIVGKRSLEHTSIQR